MRVGTDTTKYPVFARKGALWTLDRIAELGLDGAFFRSPFDLSPALDPGELREVAAHARALGLYLEVGIAKVNPFATPESPRIRELGGGDYLAGFATLVRAVTEVGITELWTATANYQFTIRGMYACDRFRTDVDWTEQLAATATVLDRLAPVIRDSGAHLNIETHEEISSFEVVRLVEDAGPDAFGITFDVANVVVRGEHPVEAARRVAPYVRQSHIRDVALIRTATGIGRFLVPVGRGVVDWDELLTVLVTECPDATLSIEGDFPHAWRTETEMTLFVNDPVWRAAHPDLTDAELASVVDLISPSFDEEALRAPLSEEQALDFITTSAASLRQHLAGLGKTCN
ncbi:TIM barrel protein [Actinoplanes sp. NPDC023936]|uniref:sugar phosphate isomerase/epimerase family protein n=1 Tax=Actinoplanes sp. NPDC023936 TaxID=3154910 RepID=UPI0033CBD56E